VSSRAEYDGGREVGWSAISGRTWARPRERQHSWFYRLMTCSLSMGIWRHQVTLFSEIGLAQRTVRCVQNIR
jgi:hypothetical protein